MEIKIVKRGGLTMGVLYVSGDQRINISNTASCVVWRCNRQRKFYVYHFEASRRDRQTEGEGVVGRDIIF
jgi:hypothetical protein